jgi:HlyD family secretion protein
MIAPLNTSVIASPADGAIVGMPIQYGETVKNGQLLYQISSSKFIADYKNALMQFLKAKSDFNLSQTQLSEADFLHKNQLISDDDFNMKKSNFYASRLSLLQARDSLQELMQRLDTSSIDLDKLSIADFDKISALLHNQLTSDVIQILAPADGVMLAPVKGDQESKKIQKGDNVKQGDALGLIGDLQGLSISIKVNELVVNQLHAGQAVLVSGAAFPEASLNGVIKQVDHQGEIASSGLPTFTVDIIVPTLTPAQSQSIYVGMTAKVDIKTDEKADVLIPVNAIREKDGQAWVTVYDAKRHKKIERLIQPGNTTMDAVVVTAGLTPGERIVIPHQA